MMIARLLNQWTRYVLRERIRVQLALGIPAIIVFVISGLVFLSSRSVNRQDVIERYFNASYKAHGEGQVETAELWLRKVIQLSPGDPAARFRLALIAIGEKDYHRGHRIIAELAPENRTGYGPAHVFVAAQLGRLADLQDVEQEERVRWHLSAALRDNPRDVRARQMLAEHELTQRNINDAINHYAILEQDDPAVNLLLAQLYVMKDERVDAERAAARGLRHFKSLAREDETNIDARIEWARLEAFLEHYDRAATLLSKVAAYQRIPDEKVDLLRRTLADVYFAWSEALGREQPEQVSERLQLLEMSLKFAPENLRSYHSLTKLGQEGPEIAKRVDSLVNRLMSDKRTASLIHVNLAIRAVNDGDLDLEREHLELALKAAPRLGIAANNLAWNLAVSQPEEVDRALQLANLAVEAEPERFEFRATRGRILAMADRKPEAIQDLEIAVSRLYQRHDVKQALSNLYVEVNSGVEIPENKLRPSVSRPTDRM